MIRKFTAQKIMPPRGATLFQLPSHWPQATPVDLEIGCGVGWHSLTYAQQNPDRFLIAVERTAAKFKKFHQRFSHHTHLSNLLPVHADIVPWAVHCLPDHSLSRIFILYPNPYPKNQAARFFKMPFLGELLKKGRSDLTIHLATNESFYQLEALEEARSTWNLELLHQQTLTLENFPKPRTHFEKKYLLRGECCYDLVFRKTKETL